MVTDCRRYSTVIVRHRCREITSWATPRGRAIEWSFGMSVLLFSSSSVLLLLHLAFPSRIRGRTFNDRAAHRPGGMYHSLHAVQRAITVLHLL